VTGMNFSSKNAIYLQIGDYICENILLKKWVGGDKIPSIRDMAVDVEVNPNTVLRTYNYLQEKDIIQNQRGIGYFVAENGFEKTRHHMTDMFINFELPKIFRTMDLLNFKLEDIEPYYNKYGKTLKK
jgi:DNA-binding transcriptional regulator YhcF (GntR family)